MKKKPFIPFTSRVVIRIPVTVRHIRSITSFFSLPAFPQYRSSSIEERTQRIRLAMLDALGHEGHLRYPYAVRQIDGAQDAQGLWFARVELMDAMSATHGEEQAQALLAHVSAMFSGLLPSGLAVGASRKTKPSADGASPVVNS